MSVKKVIEDGGDKKSFTLCYFATDYKQRKKQVLVQRFIKKCYKKYKSMGYDFVNRGSLCYTLEVGNKK